MKRPLPGEPEPLPLPLFLDLAGRACLVVGGGEPLAPKLAALREAGAVVTLVAERVDDALLPWVEGEGITWLRIPFDPAQLEGVWLVVAAPGEGVAVDALREACAERRLFLNVVDLPTHCSATWPAVVRRPPVQAAFSTQGRSPALAGYLRRELERLLPNEGVPELVAWLEGWRAESRRRFPDLAARARVWEEAMARGVVRLHLDGRVAEADALMADCLLSSPRPGSG